MEAITPFCLFGHYYSLLRPLCVYLHRDSFLSKIENYAHAIYLSL